MSETVLIADDDRGLVSVLSEALAEEGYLVRVAFDGQMALDALERVPTDLVVADIVMPRIDGLALARTLLARADPVPVILLSGHARRLELPNLVFLGKPFDIDDLLEAVAQVLADPTGVNRLRLPPALPESTAAAAVG